MGLFKDEKKYGDAARKTAREEGEGGSAREIRKRGTLYDHDNVKTGPITSIKDSIRTLRGK